MHPYHHFNFCPRCKGEVEQVKEFELVCKNCSFHIYLNPIPCNALIIENSRGEILLIIRRYDPGKGMLDLPGGFIDSKETLEESVIRESKEELGFEPENLEYVGSYPDRYLFQGINYHTICAVFCAKTNFNNFQALDDVGEVKFFNKNDLPFSKFAFPYIDQTLRDYLGKK